MTKADIVNEISKSTGVEKAQVQQIVESFMESIKDSLTANKNVYLRGFGSFIVKRRAEKVARNIACDELNAQRLDTLARTVIAVGECELSKKNLDATITRIEADL